MPSKLSPHWLPYHRSGDDRQTLARWNPPVVKIVWSDAPPYLDDIPPDATVIVRHHPTSEMNGQRGFQNQTHAIAEGHKASSFYGDMATTIHPVIDINRLVFSGLNEPRLWSDEPPDLTAAYYAAFANRLHEYGLRAGVLNFGVGWPANAGTDTLPIWEPFGPVYDALNETDLVILNEYWDTPGPQQNWGWWAGRYTQCPWQGIRVVIGECGIDRYVADGNVDANSRGWQGNVSEEVYANQLIQYDAELRKDPRIIGACIYTYDYSNPWASFNIRGTGVIPRLIEYAQSIANEPDPIVYPPTPIPDPRIIDVTDSLPKHDTKRYETRDVTTIKRGIIHHSVAPPDLPAERVAWWHVEKREFPGIGYHFYILENGEINQANRLNTISWHAFGHNDDSIGICFAGYLHEQAPTPEQLASGKWLIQFLDDAVGPLQWIGHKDVAATLCPGTGQWWEAMLSEEDEGIDLAAIRTGLEYVIAAARDAEDSAHTAKVSATYAKEKARELLAMLK